MPTFRIAHLRQSGQDIILVPVNNDFEFKTNSEQAGIVNELQQRARAAGLAGSVATIWENGSYTKFRAPPNWHNYIKSIGMHGVINNLNKTLYW